MQLELAKKVVLRATYETLVFHSKFEKFDSEQVHKRVEDVFSEGYVSRLLNILTREGLVESEQYDEHSAVFYTVSDEGIIAAEKLASLSELLTSAEAEGATQSTATIPASNRIVSLTDNQAEIEEISGSLDQLGKLLTSGDNEIGAELGDERELILAEVEASRELTKYDRFRIGKLANLIVPALQYLSEKFGNAAIGELSKKLINLILGLL